MSRRPIGVLLALALLLGACGDKEDDSGAADDTAVVDDTGSSGLSDACALAMEHNACDECYDGEVTCSYGDVSETRGSCGDCQARSALYASLCEAGVTDSRADIEAGATCSDPAQ